MKYQLVIILLLYFVSQSRAQYSRAWELDTSFSFGKGHSAFKDPFNPVPGMGPSGTVKTIAIQSDGKILIGGDFHSYNGILRDGIVRVLPNGMVDRTFNSIPGSNGANGSVNVIKVESNGKILIAGSFDSYNNVLVSKLARLNSDGSLSYTIANEVRLGSIYCLEVLANGKMLIGGDFTRINGVFRYGVARLTNTGALDASFISGLSSGSLVNSIAIQPDSKLIIGGMFSSYSSFLRNNITRTNLNGGIDFTFNVGSGTNGPINQVKMLSDGNVLIAGQFTTYNGVSNAKLVRLLSNGVIDSTFISPLSNVSSINSMLLTSGNKILIGGLFEDYNFSGRNNVCRLNLDGNVDTAFSMGQSPSGEVNIITTADNQHFFIGGNFINVDDKVKRFFAKINNSGKLEMQFNTNLGFDHIVFNSQISTDNKIIAVGSFMSYNDIKANRIVRLYENGEYDSTFKSDNIIDGGIKFVRSYQDGKLLISGDFTSINGLSLNGIGRLSKDGELDTTFRPFLGNTIFVNDIEVSNTGQFYISYYNSDLNRNIIGKYNYNGSIDSSFFYGSGVNGVVSCITIDNLNRLVLAGNFTTYNNQTYNRLVRIEPNGYIDTSFRLIDSNLTFGGASGPITVVSLQSDGKLLVYGDFNAFSGVSSSGFVRVNSDGSLDNTFNFGGGDDNKILDIVSLSNGYIMIGGHFTQINGQIRRRIARLTSIGTLDTMFRFNADFNGTINTMYVNTDQTKLVVAGDFSHFNDIYRPRIARINLFGSVVGVESDFLVSKTIKAFPNPIVDVFQVFSTKPFHYQIITIEGKAFGQGFSSSPELSLSTSAWPSGTYILRIITEEGVSVRKLVKE